MSRYRFIAEHRQSYPIRRLCQVIEVSVSGYYAWLKRKPSQREQANAGLCQQIVAIHARSRQTYGYLRVHAELRAAGERVGKHRVARLMAHLALRTKGHRRFRVTTQPNAQHRRAPNRLGGDFRATQLNQKWVADITYIPTHEGWLYLAAIQDTFSRRIVGWSMGERLTRSLVVDAWKMARCRLATLPPRS